MNIFNLLKSDHKEVLSMIKDIKSSSKMSKTQRQQQFSKMRDALLPHMHAEENYFYAYLMDHGGKRDILLEAIEEHRAARSVMQDIESTQADDESWVAKVSVLEELLKHHIQEEEGEIFQQAKKIIDDKLAQEIGNHFKELEQEEMKAR